MKKINILIILLIFGFHSSNLRSNPVDTTASKQIAVNWYLHYNPSNYKGYNSCNRYSVIYNNNVCLYVYSFNNSSNVIVAGDDNARPVLGYSFEEPFDTNNYINNENFYFWLEHYCIQIDSSRILNYNNDSTIGEWNNILTNKFNDAKDINPCYAAPLIQTHWGQDLTADWNSNSIGFNYYCPSSSGCSCQRCATGCVATAMAQVMNYWQKPYYFDWCNMPVPYLYSYDPNLSSEVNAVATLMKSCGDNVGMVYCEGIPCVSTYNNSKDCESAPCTITIGTTISNGLSGFSYNSDHERYWDHTVKEWDDFIENDISNGRPIIYSGRSHTFILDYYCEATGYCHFNWGWNGLYDSEYLSLASINPPCSGCDFNSNQVANFNIKPNYWCDDVINISNVVGYSTPPNIAAGYINVDNTTISNQANVTFIGHHQITMENFTAEGGCKFIAQIIPCNCSSVSSPGSKLIANNSQNSSNYQTSNDTIQNKNNSTTNIPNNNTLQVYLSIMPNPNNGNMNVSYAIPKDETGVLEIYNTLGTKLISYPLIEGKNTFSINGGNLNTGIYYYRATAGNKTIAKDKIVVIK